MKRWKVDKMILRKTIIRDDFLNRNAAIIEESHLIKEHIDDPLNRNYHIPTEGFHTAGIPNLNRLGIPQSAETKLKISIARKGKSYEDFYGIEKASELKKKHSIRIKEHPIGWASPDYDNTGENNPMFHKSVKDIWIEKYGVNKAEEMWVLKYRTAKYNPWNKNKIKIIQFTKENIYVKTYQGLQDVMEKNPSFSKSNICHALKGKRKSANGFIWKYDS